MKEQERNGYTNDEHKEIPILESDGLHIVAAEETVCKTTMFLQSGITFPKLLLWVMLR